MYELIDTKFQVKVELLMIPKLAVFFITIFITTVQLRNQLAKFANISSTMLHHVNYLFQFIIFVKFYLRPLKCEANDIKHITIVPSVAIYRVSNIEREKARCVLLMTKT